ncbi:hypothetical protein ACH4YO_01820 [Streptomyces noursei]|uniref:hypothetical protein n=1 Tax=Streptomyces noursei TaxID=1971 RepID=UPI0033CD9AA1
MGISMGAAGGVGRWLRWWGGVGWGCLGWESVFEAGAPHGLHERREHHLARALAEATDAEPDDITVQIAAGLLSTVHRVLFHRIQTLTLAGRPEDEIARLVAAEAAEAFGLLEPALSDYATA